MPLDADDISDLYARHARQLVAFFARRTFDPEVAVELMSETFACVVADRRRCRASTPEEVLAWLYGIARNRYADWLRHARVERHAPARVGVPAAQLSDAELERIDELAGTARLRGEVADRLHDSRPTSRSRCACASSRSARTRTSPQRSASASRPRAHVCRGRCARSVPRWRRRAMRERDGDDVAAAVCAFDAPAVGRRHARGARP